METPDAGVEGERGLVALAEGSSENARLHLDKALELDPKHPDAEFWREGRKRMRRRSLGPAGLRRTLEQKAEEAYARRRSRLRAVRDLDPSDHGVHPEVSPVVRERLLGLSADLLA